MKGEIKNSVAKPVILNGELANQVQKNMSKSTNEVVKEILIYLGVQPRIDEDTKMLVFDTIDGPKSQNQILEYIRKMLGFDKQCFQCLDYKLHAEMSYVQDTGLFVCHDCADKILSGQQAPNLIYE